MNWISKVLKEAEIAETPTSFLYWSAMAAIAAVAANHVYINRRGIYQLRPNIYVMLMAKSGLGKGFPVNVAKKCVTLAKCTRVIAGRNSIQSVVREISQQVTNEDGTPPFTDSRGFFVSSEFATSIIRDEQALTILTDLYDGQWNEEWTNKIISRGNEKLIKPNLTLLSGSSPSHFFDSIPQANITGGFVGRMLIVHEEKRSKINDLMSDVEGEDIEDFVFPYADLAAYLRIIYEEIKDKERKFMWSKSAAHTWRSWYTPARQKEETEADDKTGFKSRLPDHVLKVAMCLSLADDARLVIRDEHITEAIEQTSLLGYSSKRVSSGTGKDPLGPIAKIILDHLLNAPNCEMPRRKLLQKGYGDYDSAVLDRIIDQVLTETGWITKERIVAGSSSDWLYKLTPEAIAQYREYKEQIKE